METKMNDKTEVKKIAKTLASAMIEKVREQGLIMEIMDDKFGYQDLIDSITYYFGMEILKDGRIYIHNSDKFDENEVAAVDALYTLVMTAENLGGDDENTD